MRVAIYDPASGDVEDAVDLPDGWTIDEDGAAARGPATYYNNGEPVEYEGVYAAPDDRLLSEHAEASIGWTWSDGEFVAPEPEPTTLPNEIPMWRIRAILAEDDIEDDLDAAVESLPDTSETRLIKSMWRRGGAPNLVRDSSRVAAMVAAFSGAPLHLTWEMVDDWRERAVALEA